MKRLAIFMKLREDAVERYLELHRHVWPELEQVAKDAGIRNHSVFRLGLVLVAYLEADDIDAALARTKDHPVKQRWDALMSELLDPAAPPVVMEEAYYLE